MGLFDIFSRKGSHTLITSVDKLLEIIDHSLVVFKDGVKDYLYNDGQGFTEYLSSMASLERSPAKSWRRKCSPLSWLRCLPLPKTPILLRNS